ncbi:YkvA family protein [Falsiroseomonas tokyonensis]|uniref:YkvA family protein n=1 Tax=Falsiroseomonas tokyonensis TaxID=430521 RepID=A0ABV7BVV9_9PROT|nr:YkvA family protein [Falsiroseomonas tokyonensis]
MDSARPAGLWARLKAWAKTLKRDVVALWLAARDPRTPWPARLFCAAIAAYALSPIDLIPDVIPVLGYLDEVILLPLALWLAIRLVPAPLMQEFRAEAERRATRPVSRLAAALIVGLWIAAAALLLRAAWP